MGNSVSGVQGAERHSSHVSRQRVVSVPRSRNSRRLSSSDNDHASQEVHGFRRISTTPSYSAQETFRPRLDVQQTCVVKNLVNLKKNTLRARQDGDMIFLSFTVDAIAPFRLSVYYLVEEEEEGGDSLYKFTSPYSSSFPSREFQPSLDLKIETLAEEAIDLKKFPINILCDENEERLPMEESDSLAESNNANSSNHSLPELVQRELGKESTQRNGKDGKYIHPIVIELKSLPDSFASILPSNAVKCQYSYARLMKALDRRLLYSVSRKDVTVENNCVKRKASCDENRGDEIFGQGVGNFIDEKSNENLHEQFHAVVTKQKIHFKDRAFDVQDIFGIERAPSEADSQQVEDMGELLSGVECVICLAEERNTAVLPCRHMCLCKGCTNIMRMQSNKCPICRQTVTSLLQITATRNSDE